MKAYRVPGLTGESPETALLWDLGCLGLQEEEGIDGVGVLAYFAAEVDVPLPGAWVELPDIDHVGAYLASLAPVRCGTVVVAPSHRQAVLERGETVVWLDPGTAFGTGHHETTAMALEALCGLELRGRTVLDLGTGSGLLAIGADRLGAERTYGLDIDPEAVRVARENAALNRSRARFALGTLGAAPVGVAGEEWAEAAGAHAGSAPLAGLPGRFDVIVANLFAELHAALFGEYVARLLPDGALVLTGILVTHRTLVTRAAPRRLRLMREEARGDWLLLEYRLTETP
ncbi:MAG: 50S ribosomal protein L11 methyltransferase [Trueperaceae bacterium]|nr:50S ribosomal protein L11 methyltransferase [Trueperaceae bacterium]